MVRIFRGTCEAVRALHDYHTASGSQTRPHPSPPRHSEPSASHLKDHHPDDEEGDELLSHPEGDGDSSVNVPLVKRHRVEVEDGFDDDDDSKIPDPQNGNQEPGKSELVPYAHRDIKPG